MNDLERRYRWLLNIYPRPYREYRLDEMLETLLATADEHQRRPSLREAASLVVGGLRARTGADRLRSPVALRHSALRLSALALLVYGLTLAAVAPVADLAQIGYGAPAGIVDVWGVAIAAALAVALLATAWGAYRVAFVAAVVTVGAQHAHAGVSAGTWPADIVRNAGDSRLWPVLLAALALLPLLRAPRTRVTRPWVWLVPTVLAIVAFTPSPLNDWSDARTMSLYAFAAVALLAAPIDTRAPIAAFALLLVPASARISYHLLHTASAAHDLRVSAAPIATLAALLAATLAAATVTSRRHARM